MKRIITNAEDACCPRCITGKRAIIGPNNTPICERCGNDLLIDRRTGETFVPIYGPARTFQASKYTPPVPCRRESNRLWPESKERRAQVAV